MNRILLFSVAGVAATAVAATPAVAGLSGNRSFSHNLPVRAPTAARTVHFADEDHPTATPTTPQGSPTPTHTSPTRAAKQESEPGDDHGGDRVTTAPTGTAAPTSRHEAEPGDDHRGDRSPTATGTGAATTSPRPTRSPEPAATTPSHEPGDDRGGLTPTATSATLAPTTTPAPTSSQPGDRHGGGGSGGDDGGSHG
ncbi:MAG: hypothetical protein QOJ11_4416 [Frankiales bacterium]|jgi:hypothetical protein|nr:hypothetical protein [Frankiales bacterium]